LDVNPQKIFVRISLLSSSVNKSSLVGSKVFSSPPPPPSSVVLFSSDNRHLSILFTSSMHIPKEVAWNPVVKRESSKVS